MRFKNSKPRPRAAQLDREIETALASAPKTAWGQRHSVQPTAHATKKADEAHVDTLALGTKWAEDRFREAPDYSAFTPDMVWVDPAVVPSAKKREDMKNTICAVAAKRMRTLRDADVRTRAFGVQEDRSSRHHSTRKVPWPDC